MEKRIATLGDSLLQINPEIKFTYLGDDYNTLQILSDHEKPTQEEIELPNKLNKKLIIRITKFKDNKNTPLSKS